MTVRFCTHCWAQYAMEETTCVHCGAPLVGPDLDGVPYVDKLLDALRHHESEIRTRAVQLLGLIGEPGDMRVIHALTQVLASDDLANNIHDAELQAAVAVALGQLRACSASAALRRLALDETTALHVNLSAVEALAQLAQDGCGQAWQCIETLAREAGRSAVRREVSTALARLNEPQ